MAVAQKQHWQEVAGVGAEQARGRVRRGGEGPRRGRPLAAAGMASGTRAATGSLVMALLAWLCACPEGRVAVVAHPAGVAVVAKRVLGQSASTRSSSAAGDEKSGGARDGPVHAAVPLPNWFGPVGSYGVADCGVPPPPRASRSASSPATVTWWFASRSSNFPAARTHCEFDILRKMEMTCGPTLSLGLTCYPGRDYHFPSM